MLIQLHMQNIKDYKDTKVIAQCDLSKMKHHEDFRKWVREITEEHPLSDGYIWMACEESSEFFVMTEANKSLETD